MPGRVLVILVLLLAGCIATNDDRWRLFNDDGVQLFASGNYADALESFDHALTFRPQDAVLLYNAGQCHDRLGDYRRAEETYVYCLQRDPRHGDARLALVALKHRSGRLAEAHQLIQDWLKASPELADPYVADAWRLRHERAYPQAQGRLQQALALEPSNRRALTELAILNELQGAPERALALYEQILIREPNQVDIAERAERLKALGGKRSVPR